MILFRECNFRNKIHHQFSTPALKGLLPVYYPALTKTSKSIIKTVFPLRLSINYSSTITTAITEWYWTLRDRLESNVVVDFSCKNIVWELRSPKWPPKVDKSKLQIHLAYFWNQNLQTLLCAINSSRCVDIFCKKNQQKTRSEKKVMVQSLSTPALNSINIYIPAETRYVGWKRSSR